MFIITRRSAGPQLRLVPGAVARFHGDQVTLLPLSADQETGLSVQPLAGGGYGVILSVGEKDTSSLVVAQYPTVRLARRQLHRLAGNAGGSGRLGRGLLVAGLLFLVWFLFFLPSDLSVLPVGLPRGDDAVDAAPTALGDAAETTPGPIRSAAPMTSTGPALIDDPAAGEPSPPPASAPNGFDALLHPPALRQRR